LSRAFEAVHNGIAQDRPQGARIACETLEVQMKTRGYLLLAAAASLAPVTATRAADLPVKAKPVEYVKICTLYGPGFYYIPGTDTCIRIGGQIRSEVSFLGRSNGDQSWAIGDGLATRTRDRDVFFTRVRVYTNVDTRTSTGFGVLRTFSVVRAEHATAVGLGAAAGAINIDTGVIQWGGFSIGRVASSYFDNPWSYAFKWGGNGSYGWSDSTSGRFVAAYTHTFGNGISATLSLEDNKHQKRGIYNGANTLSAFGTNSPTVDTRGGNTWPEIIGQLRIEQAWGAFHLAGNLMNNHVAYNCGSTSSGAGFSVSSATGLIVPTAACTELSGNPSDKVGGGVTAALMIKTPTGVNDAFYIGGTWSKGATADVFRNNGPGSAFGIFGGSSVPGVYGSLAGGYVWDSVYSSTARTGAGITVGPVGQQLTTAYGGSVAFEHGWNAEWRTSVFGGVEVIDYNTTANAILCSRFSSAAAAPGLLSNFNTSCNMDYRIVGAGTRTYWTPVRDLTIGLEFQWSNHHSSNEGATLTVPATVVQNFKPGGVTYEIKDQNVFSGIFSVRRFF
jgi:hypothetical protein